MFQKFDVFVFYRNQFRYKTEKEAVIIDVVIPEKYLWELVDQFRKSFGTYDDELGSLIRTIESDADGWHIKLIFWERDEEKFYEFLRGFCRPKSIKFKEPE